MPTIDALQVSRWDESLFKTWRDGGVVGVHVTCAIWENAVETIRNLSDWRRRFKEHSEYIRPGLSGEDLDASLADGRTSVILGFQNSSPIENDVSLVPALWDLGVRVMQLTYNNQSLIGSGCYESSDAGITRFGREVIAEMNEVGMLIDLSHCGGRTTLEGIEMSERPVAITHSNPVEVHGSIRNKSDEALKLLREKDGMLGLSLYPLHLPNGSDTTFDDFCGVIDHAVNIVGEDNIGLGSDLSQHFDQDHLDWIRSGRWSRGVDFGEGSATNRDWPKSLDWFRDSADFVTIGEKLAERYGQDLTDKLTWSNWLRFFRDAFVPAG